MVSGTSFFNGTIYRKTMSRFWPLWVFYGIIWLFLIPLNLVNKSSQYQGTHVSTEEIQSQILTQCMEVPMLLTIGVWLAAGFGVLCAMAVFSYLYNNRSACMMHALPVRREELFWSNYLAGLSFLLLPNLAVAVVTAGVELTLLSPESWGRGLYALAVWFLCQSGFCVFFFSFAVFCAMFTGHILALPAFYGILNVLVFAVVSLLNEMMSWFFYGYAYTSIDNWVEYCTPVLKLSNACGWSGSISTALEDVRKVISPYSLSSPLTIAAYAGVGVIFAVLAQWIYEYRHIETAGDVIAVPLVRPLFQYGVAFCSGLFFGVFTANFFDWSREYLLLSVCIVLWAVVGYFAAEMLLRKSFRVWNAWPGGLVTAAVLAVLCLLCYTDVFGVVARVPEVEKVASLSVSSFGYPNDSGKTTFTLTDPEKIQEYLDLHHAIIAEQDRTWEGTNYQAGDSSIYLRLTYTLKNGSTLTRYYRDVPMFQSEVEQQGTATWAANRILQDRELTATAYGFDTLEQGDLVQVNLTNVYIGKGDYYDSIDLEDSTKQSFTDLWKAVRQDFDEGTIGTRYLFYNDEMEENIYTTELEFVWLMPSSDQSGRNGSGDLTYCYVTLTPNAKHTLAWLEESGALEDSAGLRTQAEENRK
jgi:ABC-2 type transport system permease protein